MKETTPPDGETLFSRGQHSGSDFNHRFWWRFQIFLRRECARYEEIEYGRVHRMAIDDRPVINNTGLKGYYDFHMNLSTQDFQTMWIWAAMAGGAEVPPQLIPRGDGLSLDSVVNSMKDVGLQLERGKGPVDILGVDSVQRKPTEN
jgi:uncharacterized protein (TIGR03435 family)